eukprot:1157782-Pelagomonas_calceolata.AAC.5
MPGAVLPVNNLHQNTLVLRRLTCAFIAPWSDNGEAFPPVSVQCSSHVPRGCSFTLPLSCLHALSHAIVSHCRLLWHEGIPWISRTPASLGVCRDLKEQLGTSWGQLLNSPIGGGGLEGVDILGPPFQSFSGPLLQNSKSIFGFLRSRTVDWHPLNANWVKGGSVCMAGSQCHARKGVGSKGCKCKGAANQSKFPGW